jgi:ornithine cyclodeaminase/alanine dehydrogenase-like protein (mu-crystallin family)
VAGVADLSEVRVYSPSVANRTSFAERMAAALDVPVAPADGVKAALAGVDAAYVATAARSPVVVADDVRKLRLVAAVGATRPDHHELAADVIAEAGVVVVDCPDALIEPGDMIDAGRDGWSPEEALLLGDWLARPFVSTDDRPVLFKSIGSIEQDLVLCRQLLAAADERDLGREVAEVGTLRVMR